LLLYVANGLFFQRLGIGGSPALEEVVQMVKKALLIAFRQKREPAIGSLFFLCNQPTNA
jgi:hypothetical protein